MGEIIFDYRDAVHAHNQLAKRHDDLLKSHHATVEKLVLLENAASEAAEKANTNSEGERHLKERLDVITVENRELAERLAATETVMRNRAETAVEEWNNLVALNKEKTDRIAELEEIAKTNEDARAEQNAVIAYLEKQKAASQDSTHTIIEKITKSVKLPDPPAFAADGTLTVEDWLIMMRKKLKANAYLYNNEDLRITYVQQLVTGKAKAHLRPRLMDDTTNPFTTAEQMLKLLEERFRDVHRRTNAMNQFRRLYQNQMTFRDFWAEFLSLTAEFDMNEDMLIHELRSRINDETARHVATAQNIKTVVDLADLCQQYENNTKNLRSVKEARMTNSSTTPNAGRAGTPAKGGASATATATPNPIRGPRLPAEEFEARRAARKCYHCGKFGHMARDCRSKTAGTAPAGPPAIKIDVRSNELPVELPAENDELLDQSLQE